MQRYLQYVVCIRSFTLVLRVMDKTYAFVNCSIGTGFVTEWLYSEYEGPRKHHLMVRVQAGNSKAHAT